MLLTVLSGAVAVQTARGAEVVHGGQRVVTVGDSSSTQTVEQMEYIRKWLSEPGKEGSPEVLSLAWVREHLITGMWAADWQTGDVRHITDFLSSNVRAVRRFGPHLVLMNRPSVLFAHFGDQPIGGAGRPIVSNAAVLVNLRTGAKLELSALEGYSALSSELSPDRRKLAFTGLRKSDPNAASGAPQSGLYVLDMETLRISLLLPGDLKTAPHWSPDSRWVAVSAANGYSDRQSLVLVDTVSAKVVETGINGANAHFTPDGKQIVCCSGFKAGGSFMDGVPVWGNLFIFTLPDGKPRPLTQLPGGGAIEPSFSPDGAYLAYWEYPRDKSAMRTLHIVNMKTERDIPVTKAGRCEVEWLSPTALSLAPMMQGDRPMELKVVELKGETWTPRVVVLKRAQPTPEQMKAAAALAEDLFTVFRTYRDAVDACDLHQIDRTQAGFKEARDSLLEIQKKLPGGNEAGAGSPGGLALTQDDLAPYVREFGREADMTPNQRINGIVRASLNYYIPTLLGMYVQDEKKMPESMEALTRYALAREWQINHVRASDTARARHLFLVPGDRPDRTTSFRIVSRDDAAGTLVIESAALPDGRKLRATFKKEISGDGKRISFRQPAITEEANHPATTPAR